MNGDLRGPGPETLCGFDVFAMLGKLRSIELELLIVLSEDL